MVAALISKENDCRSCYKCIRNCPTKAISFSDGQARIENDECIYCGRCYEVCPQSCKIIRDETSAVSRLLKSGPVYASIAPSYLAAYPGTSFEKMREALIKLGFADAEETAIGATIVKKEYDRLAKEQKMDVIISTCCHSINLLVEKYYPELVGCLAPVLSPMQAHALDLKRRHPGAKVVFVGPCISKKDEIDQYPGYDENVLTFLELSKMFEEAGIEVESDPNPKSAEESLARLFPTEGGILATMAKENKDYVYLSFSGKQEVLPALENIRSGKVHRAFIELSSCPGSCVNGPAMPKGNKELVNALISIKRSAGKKDFKVDEYRQNDISKQFLGESFNLPEPSEEEIHKVLRQIGKERKEDELNCSCCGYPTCRDKAIAVIRGKASLEMCLPYLSKKASSFASYVIDNSPNGIIVVSDDLSISMANAAFCLFTHHEASSIVGHSLDEIMDPTLFALALSGEPTRGKHIELAQYGLFVEATVTYDPQYKIIVGIFRDRTAQHNEHEQYVANARKTAEITSDVIEKNMRAVQEIAQLLGESAANTKIALTNLSKTIAPEEKDGK